MAGDTRNPKVPQQMDLKFDTITLRSDSHGRHLAGLLKDRVTAKTRVYGVCKPGAKLLNVTACDPPPPGSCIILMAGTNDLAAGEQETIYRHLEQQITALLSTAKVVVSTLPERHDLPVNHPINQHTALTNSFIEKLCAQNHGVDLLDFNKIGRRFFTRHGMHLRLSGKRLMTGLLMESLRRLERAVPAERCPPPPVIAPKTLATPTQPVTLPHDSFADAVKGLSALPLKGIKEASPKQKNDGGGMSVATG